MVGATTATTNNTTTAVMSGFPLEITKRHMPAIRRKRNGSPSKTPQHLSNQPLATDEFNPRACLFCTQLLPSQQSAKIHMQKEHGLQVPFERHLIVEWEALIKYLHLIIHEYHECIYCHTERNSSGAVLEHMINKHHCQINVDEQGSEFREFYDFGATDSESSEDLDEEEDADFESDEGSEQEASQKDDSGLPFGATEIDEVLRLPSGKMIASRKGGALKPPRPPHHRRTSPSQSAISHQASASSPSQGPSNPRETAIIKRANTRSSLILSDDTEDRRFAVRQATIRESDRQALAHLSLPEQRAVISTAQKQEEKAERAQKNIGGRLDGMANLKISERFVNDVPGGKAHKNRFFAR